MASIQGIGLAVKKREVLIWSFLLEKDEEREDRRMVPRKMEFIEIKSKKEHT